jgi:hypothetical protein
MAIGRSEDRDNPRDPLVLRHHGNVWDPVRVPHLGQRSFDRTTQAEHMIAIDQTPSRSCNVLARPGPSTYGSRPAPGKTRRAMPR